MPYCALRTSATVSKSYTHSESATVCRRWAVFSGAWLSSASLKTWQETRKWMKTLGHPRSDKLPLTSQLLTGIVRRGKHASTTREQKPRERTQKLPPAKNRAFSPEVIFVLARVFNSFALLGQRRLRLGHTVRNFKTRKLQVLSWWSQT